MSELTDWARLRNDVCSCGYAAGIRINRNYVTLLRLLEERAELPGRPTDAVLSYHCGRCGRMLRFTHDDILAARGKTLTVNR